MGRNQASQAKRERGGLSKIRSSYNNFLDLVNQFVSNDTTESAALKDQFKEYKEILPINQTVEEYTKQLHAITDPEGLIYSLMQDAKATLLIEEADKIYENLDLTQVKEVEKVLNRQKEEFKKVLSEKEAEFQQKLADFEKDLKEKQEKEKQEKEASDKVLKDKILAKEAEERKKILEEQESIEAHIQSDKSNLKKIHEQKDISAKVTFVQQGIEYLKQITAAELSNAKYVLDFSKFEIADQPINIANFTTKARVDISENSRVTHSELDQMIGWIEYLSIKKAYAGQDVNKNIDILCNDDRNLKITTKIAYIEDKLSCHKADYDSTKINVTHSDISGTATAVKLVTGIFSKSINPVCNKEVPLSEFLATSLKHVASEYYQGNHMMCENYLSACINSIDSYDKGAYDTATKTGLHVDISTLTY